MAASWPKEALSRVFKETDAIEKMQRRFPDFAFSELADGDANSGVGRLPWGFGPPGEPRKLTGIDVLGRI